MDDDATKPTLLTLIAPNLGSFALFLPHPSSTLSFPAALDAPLVL